MGRTWVVLWVLLAGGCQNVFGISEVGEGDASGAASGIAFRNQWSALTALGTVPTALVTFDEPPLDGDLIVVLVAWWHNTPTMVTDNTGQNRYVMLPTTALSGGGSNLWIYYAYDIVSAPQFAITVVSTPSGNDELAVVAHDYSGVGPAGGVDGQVDADGDPGAMPVVSDCKPITATQADVMVTGLTRDFNGSPAVSDGWHLRTSLNSPHDSFMVLATADRIAGPETAEPIWTSDRTTGGYSWACLTAAFR